MTISRKEYQEAFDRKSNRSRGIDKAKSNKTTAEGDSIQIRVSKDYKGVDRDRYVERLAGRIDWQGIDSKHRKESKKISRELQRLNQRSVSVATSLKPPKYSNLKEDYDPKELFAIFQKELEYAAKKLNMPELLTIDFKTSNAVATKMGHFRAPITKQGIIQAPEIVVSKYTHPDAIKNTMQHEIAHAVGFFTQYPKAARSYWEYMNNKSRINRNMFVDNMAAIYDIRIINHQNTDQGHGKSWRNSGKMLDYDPLSTWNPPWNKKYPNNELSKRMRKMKFMRSTGRIEITQRFSDYLDRNGEGKEKYLDLIKSYKRNGKTFYIAITESNQPYKINDSSVVRVVK